MTAVARFARGLFHRPGASLAILIVALVASAAAAIAPTYYQSARTSILRDTLYSAPIIQQGFEVNRQAVISHVFTSFSDAYDEAMRQLLPDDALRARALQPPIKAIEGTAFFSDSGQNPVLAWRTDMCSQLRFTQGACPSSKNTVAISESLAKANGWKLGTKLTPQGWPEFTVTAVYAVPDFSTPYWFGRGGRYFPAEDAAGGAVNLGAAPPADAMFTTQETLDQGTQFAQGILVVDTLIDRAHIRGSDLDKLVAAINGLTATPSIGAFGISVASDLSGVRDDIHSSWQTLLVTEVLIGIQLLMLVWLLMFLLVRDAIEVRGSEIALMKLRGYRGFRLLSFGLAEPAGLLLIALPAGVLVGWAASGWLVSQQLREGTSVSLPWLAWLTAAAATVGGLAAVVVAGRRTLRRQVVDEWRRTARGSTERGWVLDAILVTGAVAGLVELEVSGQITSVAGGTLGLLEPGLIGLAVAVIASRLLPVVSRALFARTRHRGGLGLFLAVRQVARRPGGVRTTMILGTAFALATFGVVAWSTGQGNRAFVAKMSVGAPVVAIVASPADADLGAAVDSLDPSGTQAAVAETYVNGGAELLAVDPDRFGQVAAWRTNLAGGASLPSLMQKLSPPAAEPIPLQGDELRVRLHVENLKMKGEVLSADVATRGAGIPVQVQFGSIDVEDGDVVLTADLGGCPCRLVSLSFAPSTTPGGGGGPIISGAFVLQGIDVKQAGAWQPVAGATDPGRWRKSVDDSRESLTKASSGLRWPFAFSASKSATLTVADHPDPLPALASSSLVNGAATNIDAPGLDGHTLPVSAVETASAIPGATTDAVVVDRVYAERAAGGYRSAAVTQEVWMTADAAPRIEASLRDAGFHITDVATSEDRASLLDRQGPGLASIAFLADSVAAAVLAAGAAVMGLVTAARRRRYEYAALEATGASPRDLRTGLFAEQAGVLVYGALAGIVAGLVAAAFAGPSVPEFVSPPPSVLLSYTPDAGVLATALSVAIGCLLVVAAVCAWALLASARSEQLREAQQ